MIMNRRESISEIGGGLLVYLMVMAFEINILGAQDCTSNGVEWETDALTGWTEWTSRINSGVAWNIVTNTQHCIDATACIQMIGSNDAGNNEEVYIERTFQNTAAFDSLSFFVQGRTESFDYASETGRIQTICDSNPPVTQIDNINAHQTALTTYAECFSVDATGCDEITLRVGGTLSGGGDYVYVTKVLVTTNVDCDVSDWGEYNECSEPCGGGIQTRERTILTPPQNNGQPCEPLTDIEIACNTFECAVDCVQGAWEDDGECSLLCGTGQQLQTRPTLTPAANGGIACGPGTQTVDCNTQSCCPNGFGTFAWDTLTEEGIDIPQVQNLYFDVDYSDLTLNIEVELKYLGLTKGAVHENQPRYGTTYVLDFEDFNAHKDAIYEPGTCQNRMAGSFNDRDFVNDFWTFSDNPQNSGEIGSINTLAYPPSDKWTMLMKNDGCDTIVYSRSFTWSELRGCSGSNGLLSYTEVIHEDDKYKLKGTFYINVVSPFSYKSDLGFYRVYQILSKPFVISVSSTVHVLGSTGIDLIQMYIIAVYKENQFDEQDFRLVFMTETAEYLELELDTEPIFTFTKDGSNSNNIDGNTFTVSNKPDSPDGCLNNRDYICTQLWNIDAFNPGCTDQSGTDFSGNYELTFKAKCKTGLEQSVNDHCNTFLNDHIDGDAINGYNVMLNTDLVWHDNICAVEEFDLQFDAGMLFYTNNVFEDGTDVGNSYLFEAGVDRIYVEIDTSFPTDTYDIFNTVLTNVWICTFPYESSKQPSTFADVLQGTAVFDDMGCFNSNKDDSLAQIVNDIYPDTTSGYDVVNFQMHSETKSNIIQFSFLIPEEVTRDTLYIHAQIEVELITPIDEQPRRILLEVNTANQISHFGQQIGITHKNKPVNNPQIPNQPQQPLPYNPQVPNPNVPSSIIGLSLKSPFVILIGSLLVLILMANICYMCYANFCQKRKRKRKGYESVKRVDSELDSEAQMLDNQESN